MVSSKGLFLPVLLLTGLGRLIVAPTSAVDAPRPWPPDAFRPVTVQRIAALPAAEQPAWWAYWNESQARHRLLPPGRDLVDHSSLIPSDGPPIPSTYSQGVRLDQPAAWYASEEARVLADRVVNWQTIVGGWVKTGDYSRHREPADDHQDAWSAGTFDNDSTISELRFLALSITAAGTGESPRARVWHDAFMRGFDYALAAQYPNGGFPQIYPLVGWYHDAITLNDDAMEHIIEFFRDVGRRQPEFAFVPSALAAEASRRAERGIQCLLALQLRGPDGRPTAWGQQHDALTLQPCAARNFEPVAMTSLESAHLLRFLMTLPQPSPEIVAAIEGGVQWLEEKALRDVVWDRDAASGSGLTPQSGAPLLWARLYELGTGKPIFGERDRTIHYAVGELCNERRKGYGWYVPGPVEAIEAFKVWGPKIGQPTN